MKELPVTQKEYDQSVLVADCIAKINNIVNDRENISDIHFIPKLNGYDIIFDDNGIKMRLEINIKNRFISGLKIKKYANDNLKNVFFSQNKKDNTVILEKIF